MLGRLPMTLCLCGRLLQAGQQHCTVRQCPKACTEATQGVQATGQRQAPDAPVLAGGNCAWLGLDGPGHIKGSMQAHGSPANLMPPAGC